MNEDDNKQNKRKEKYIMADNKKRGNRVEVVMPDKDYKQLYDNAVSQNMSVSEYVRDILAKQSAVNLTIDFADVDTYVDKMTELNQKIDAILPTIYRSGKALESEALEIKQIMQEIRQTTIDTWRYVVQTRQLLYDEERKALYQKIRNNGYKRRIPTVHPVSEVPDYEESTGSDNPYQE